MPVHERWGELHVAHAAIRRHRRPGHVLAAGVLAAAMATPALTADPPPAPSPHPPSVMAGTSLAWCGDIVTPRAAPGLYRDDPVYIANEMPATRVRNWARSKPGFVDVWIDRENNGWINVMFTRGVAQRQAELERVFPGVGVVAVKVRNSRRELRTLARRVSTLIERQGIEASLGWGGTDDIVRLEVPVVTRKLVSALVPRFAGEPLCVDGRDPADLVQPGPQPLAGDGWRMLAWEEGHGPAHKVGIAADQASYAQLWARIQLDGSPPEVDFESEVVVWFAIGHGSTCPNQRMDEVIVDRGRSQVYPLVVDPDNHMGCTDDLTGAYQFVAALERSELPPGPFEIGLRDRSGELWRSLAVDADLTFPGSVAGPDAIADSPPRVARSGTFQEPFGSFDYVMDASCGIGYLGVINDVHWVAQMDAVPAAWADVVGANGDLQVTVRLRTRPSPHALVSLAGQTVRYEPAGDAPVACSD
jgi:hypothetical protein